MAGKRPRPPVQVVVAPSIPSPWEYKLQLQREQGERQDEAANGSYKRARSGGALSNGNNAAERAEFKKMWKSVMDLGAMQLTGYEKKAYDARRIVELGGKAPAAIKTPFNILMGKRAKAKQRDARRDNDIRESGVVVAKKRQSAAALANQILDDGGRRKHDSSGKIGETPYPVLGKMKGGTLFLNRGTIQRATMGKRGGRGGDKRGGRGRGEAVGSGRAAGRGRTAGKQRKG